MADSATQITRAPGKIVAWGEYAVLAGAPACVMAVDRYATVSLTTSSDIQFSATGFRATAVSQSNLAWTQAPVAALAESILKQKGYSEHPRFWHIEQDTQACYQGASKLGIGSSAALCVALYEAFAAHLEFPAVFSEALEMHRTFQGGSGSGLDVGASWFGGTIRYQNQQAQPQPWPTNLSFCVVFTGHSANTTEHVGRFSTWRDTSTTTQLDELCATCNDLTAGFSMAKLSDYITALTQLDAAAKLNIFTVEHLALMQFAKSTNVLYKPCGAGGGDIGMAFSTDPGALAEFRTLAAATFQIIDLNIASERNSK